MSLSVASETGVVAVGGVSVGVVYRLSRVFWHGLYKGEQLYIQVLLHMGFLFVTSGKVAQ